MATRHRSLDEMWMDLALEEARHCLEWGDVPVGAVVVREDEVLAAAGNQREQNKDPTAHAELIAVRAASERLGTWRLTGCSLYVTLEPCAMCAGALVLARMARLVYGARDSKGGFAGSLGDIVRDGRLNHRLEVASGVRARESTELLREFFATKRGGVPLPSPEGGPITSP
ncbi:MAG TPA: tRNA adenosine(34) deaminase TadA [Actinomycetota bacterium]|jgi:tRNA(adenine34) deaminase